MKKITFILSCTITLGACDNGNSSTGANASGTAAQEQAQLSTKDTASAQNGSIEVRPFQSEAGWGYDIYMNGKMYVHQPHIPAISGNNTFRSEADARKAGELVAHKIKNNIMPPSVTVEELDSIGVLK